MTPFGLHARLIYSWLYYCITGFPKNLPNLFPTYKMRKSNIFTEKQSKKERFNKNTKQFL